MVCFYDTVERKYYTVLQLGRYYILYNWSFQSSYEVVLSSGSSTESTGLMHESLITYLFFWFAGKCVAFQQ